MIKRQPACVALDLLVFAKDFGYIQALTDAISHLEGPLQTEDEDLKELLAPIIERLEYPLYDIDELEPPTPPASPPPSYHLAELLTNMTLEDEASVPGPPSPATPPPVTPELPHTPEHPLTRSAPTTPARRSHISSGPSTPAKLYSYYSPHASGITQHWSKAANATQGTSRSSHVHAIYQTPKRRHKNEAYVVYRGHSSGVFDNWEEVRLSTTGVRFALHQGYPTIEAAERAFKVAEDNGWTSTDTNTWLSTPISITHAPLPLPPTGTVPTSDLFTRRPDDPWFIVYSGVNPGVFPSNLECQLNVLGIHNSAHESVIGLENARAKFAGAVLRHEVHVRHSTRAARLS
ncbi:hypothetical protein C8R43DRAFT_1122944 [Mycena crocata]|nr:hypothetical protein C8R43DRAFT_1122944 [Mycena crocata]